MYTLQNSLFGSFHMNHTALNAGLMRVLAQHTETNKNPVTLYVCLQLDLRCVFGAGFASDNASFSYAAATVSSVSQVQRQHVWDCDNATIPRTPSTVKWVCLQGVTAANPH